MADEHDIDHVTLEHSSRSSTGTETFSGVSGHGCRHGLLGLHRGGRVRRMRTVSAKSLV